MKKKKGIIGLAIACVCSLLLFSACKPQPRGAFMFDYISEVLDLDEAQENKLEEIKSEIMAQVDIMHEDKDEMHGVIKQQLLGEVIDKDVVRQLVVDHRAKMDTIIDLAIERLAEFHSALTLEQREKLVEKLEKFEKRSHCFRKE